MHLPRVWAEIDLQAIADNLELCRDQLCESCQVLGVVKGDAYGHGAGPVAAVLERNGIAMLGVGDSHEAIQLREAGIGAPILILGAVVEGEMPELIRHRITPTVHSPERIQAFDRIARSLGIRLAVHLLIDTGMGRLGVSPRHAVEHLRAIFAARNLELEGIGTHLASTVEDPDFTRLQIALFQHAIDEARAEGMTLPRLHVASSSAILDFPESHFDMVRVGGFLYGIAPTPLPAGMRAPLSLCTQIVSIRDFPAGSPISYGGTSRTPAPSRIATLPVGYHDGYLHQLSNRAEVLIRGARAPVVGRITMDYITVDVTRIPGAAVTDRVTLLGEDGKERISAADLARWGGTIPYEVPSHLGARVRRFHHYGDGTARFLRRSALIREPSLETSPAHEPEYPLG